MTLSSLLWAAAALLFGAAVCLLKYLFTRKMDVARPQGILLASLVRHLCNLTGIVLLWLLSRRFGLPLGPVLIGGALGLTVPTAVLTLRGKGPGV